MRKVKEGKCAIEGCERPLYRTQYCCPHYERKRKLGDPLAGGTYHQPRIEICTAEGCGKKTVARGFCSAHYHLFKKYGDHKIAKHKWYQNKRDEWHLAHTTGYIWRYVGRNDPNASEHTGYAYQHRVVMAEIIGRPLRGNESVHHKNGDRTDNRPENLELWVKSQPAGQRASDLVEWARQILKDYEKLV